MNIPTINCFGIDTDTEGKNELIRRLKKLKTTIEVLDNGEYHQDRSYSQIHIATTWTENQLDDWLYKTKGDWDYVGIFKPSDGSEIYQFGDKNNE